MAQGWTGEPRTLLWAPPRSSRGELGGVEWCRLIIYVIKKTTGCHVKELERKLDRTLWWWRDDEIEAGQIKQGRLAEVHDMFSEGCERKETQGWSPSIFFE